MGKLRVHELAKKLGLSNQELVDKLGKAGISVKTHSSTVDEAEAMKAIGAGQQKAPEPVRPRTMVRRAAPQADTPVEVAPEPAPPPPRVVEAPVVAPAAVVRPEPRAVVQPAQPDPAPVVVTAPAPKPAVAAPAEPVRAEVRVEARPEVHAAPPAVEAAPPPAPAAVQVAPAAALPVVEAAPAAVVDTRPTANQNAAAADAAKSGGNVVRVIDADAIRARLAAENRSFAPRGPRPGPGGRGPIREIRVVSDRFGGAPTMVDVSAGAAARGPGGRPGGRPEEGNREGGGGAPGSGDRRDRGAGAGGGRDLWFNPGKKRKTGKKGKGPEITQAAQHKRVVEMDGLITVGELAHQMAIKSGQVIQKLFSMGMMVTVNQTIDFDTVSIVATEFGFEVKNVAFAEDSLLTDKKSDKKKDDATADPEALPRAPVVTIMGHVDHGKTSLLDALRKTNVVAGEAGGITQHIGAYSVETERGTITFLDTPGHAAFTSMRARGAQVTDIVILVVAADDGVMPQTAEAIQHAKAAKVPLIVAVNKVDKPEANPERVMQKLTEFALVPEDWGGDTMMIQVSAKKGTGLDKLLEGVLLQAEVLELRATPNKRAEGTIIEAQLDKGRGPVATVLVQEGTLQPGDYIVAGEHSGKVRAMINSRGESVKSAGPSMPVQVLGLSGVPNAGDKLNAVVDEKSARTIAEHRQQKAREDALKRQNSPMSNLLDFIGKQAGAEEQIEMKVIVKGDVGGSVEAIKQALEKLTTKKVRVSVIGSGVGTVTESDIQLATASKAMIVGFNSKPDPKAAALAAQEHVEIRSYNIIYELLDDVKKAMTRSLAPKVEERYLGKAEVRQVFSVPKLGLIAGSYVLDGKIVRTERARVKRGTQVLHEGGFASLRRFKDDAREVVAGYECGIGFATFNELQPGDVIECFELVEVAADLGEAIAPDSAAMQRGPQSGGASQGAQA